MEEDKLQDVAIDEKTYTGTVIWFSKGMGFIDWSKDSQKQTDLFVHWSDLSSEFMPGYKNLRKGQSVSFELGLNNQGRPKAINVIVLNGGQSKVV